MVSPGSDAWSAEVTFPIFMILNSRYPFLVGDEAMEIISRTVDISRADVEQTISFYHFFSQTPRARYNVYLNDSAVANMMGRRKVAEMFEKEANCKFGSTSEDGLIGLYNTACIGMNDQEPAAIINEKIFTKLTPFRVKEIMKDIREGKDIGDMYVSSLGDGANSSDLIKSEVVNNIRKIGPILSTDYTPGDALKKVIEVDNIKL